MGVSGLEAASFREAERLGHDWAGPQHGLLAVLRGDPDDVARRALEEAGIDAGAVERELDRMAAGDRAKRPGVTTNPAWHHAFGRAEGFAACLGAGRLEPVHLVLAFLWDDRLWQFAARQGVPREHVVEALRRAGVSLPPGPMPDLVPPLNLPAGGPPSTCQFCGGPIGDGRRFVVPAKDRSWVVFFCSPACSIGFSVSALLVGGRVRGADEPVLADEFGPEGNWYEPS